MEGAEVIENPYETEQNEEIEAEVEEIEK